MYIILYFYNIFNNLSSRIHVDTVAVRGLVYTFLKFVIELIAYTY